MNEHESWKFQMKLIRLRDKRTLWEDYKKNLVPRHEDVDLDEPDLHGMEEFDHAVECGDTDRTLP